MPASTPKWAFQYLVASDPIAQADDVSATGLTRVDLMNGELGAMTVTAAANTQVNIPVTFSRTYPGNNTTNTNVGIMWLMPYTSIPVTPINWWVGTWAGTTATITGCTVSFISSAAFTSKIFVWRYLPAAS